MAWPESITTRRHNWRLEPEFSLKSDTPAGQARIVAAYVLFTLFLSFPLVANATPPTVPAIDKPGLFKLDQSTDDAVCVPLQTMINSDIRRFGKTQFATHDEFVKWRPADESRFERGTSEKYDESLEWAEVDLNNDGIPDDVVRTQWSIHGAFADALNVVPPWNGQKLPVAEFLDSDQRIMFSFNDYWVKRRTRRYGVDNPDWVFDGIASLDLFRIKGKTYVVAQNYAAPKNVSAKVYVIRFDSANEPSDTCMLLKVCPCGGCEDLSGSEVLKTLPGKKWCGK